MSCINNFFAYFSSQIPIDRPPIFTGRGIQVELCKLVDEFKNYKLLVDGSPVEKHGLAIMDLVGTIQHCGIKLSEKNIIDKIAETLPPRWDDAKKYILEHKNQLLL